VIRSMVIGLAIAAEKTGHAPLFENPPVRELVLLGVAVLLTIALVVFFAVLIFRQDKAERDQENDEHKKRDEDHV